jgi:hypothetical protein
MSDEKTKSTASSKPDEHAQPVWPMPFQEMFEEMMRRCGCRPEQMGAMGTMCCGQPPEKQSKPREI